MPYDLDTITPMLAAKRRLEAAVQEVIKAGGSLDVYNQWLRDAGHADEQMSADRWSSIARHD